MSLPSSSTSPASAAEGTSSCMRLRIRRNVDLPQPDGPISAVMPPAGIVSDTRSSTLWSPNHAVMSTARSSASPGSAGPVVPEVTAGGSSVGCDVASIGGSRSRGWWVVVPVRADAQAPARGRRGPSSVLRLRLRQGLDLEGGRAARGVAVARPRDRELVLAGLERLLQLDLDGPVGQRPG